MQFKTKTFLEERARTKASGMVDGWANLPVSILEKIFWYANYQRPFGNGRPKMSHDDSVIVICSKVCHNWWEAISSSKKLIQEPYWSSRVEINCSKRNPYNIDSIHKRSWHVLIGKFVKTYDVDITESWKSEHFQLLSEIFNQSPNATNFIIRFPFGKDNPEDLHYRSAIISLFHNLFLSIAFCNDHPKTVAFELTKTKLTDLECDFQVHDFPGDGAIIKNLEFRIHFYQGTAIEYPFTGLPNYDQIRQCENSGVFMEAEPDWILLSERGIHIERTFLCVDIHQRTLLTFISDIRTNYLNISWRYAPCLSTLGPTQRKDLFFRHCANKEVTLFGDSMYFDFQAIMRNLRKVDLRNFHLHIKKSAKQFCPQMPSYVAMLQGELNLASVTHGYQREETKTDTLLCDRYFVF